MGRLFGILNPASDGSEVALFAFATRDSGGSLVSQFGFGRFPDPIFTIFDDFKVLGDVEFQGEMVLKRGDTISNDTNGIITFAEETDIGGLQIDLGASNATLKSSTGDVVVDDNLVVKTSLTVGSSGIPVTEILSALATLDFPSTATGNSALLTMTVSGASIGNTVALAISPASGAIPGTAFTAYVSGFETVTVAFHNFSGGNKDPTSALFRVTVFSH